ncbi:MAG: hypothetical protein KDD37_07620 [Bdellovibrionales bacterium]|nr:hypothetical protein [Bdellovibrionales bacterium]
MIIFLVLSNLLLHAMDCEDTDKGQVVNQAGVTISTVKDCSHNPCVASQIVERDSCIDSSKLLEYYCKNGESKSVVLKCPKNMPCKYGACQ